MHNFFGRAWHVDSLFHRVVHVVGRFGHETSFHSLDAGRIAYLGPYGLASATQRGSDKAARAASGYVYHYAFILLVAIVLFMASAPVNVVDLGSAAHFVLLGSLTFVRPQKAA